MNNTAFVAAAPCALQYSSAARLVRRPRWSPAQQKIGARRAVPHAALSPLPLSVPALAANAAESAAATASAAANAVSAATDAATVAAGDVAAAAGEAVREDFGNVGPSRLIASIAFCLAVYLSLGTLLLSWDEWRKKRNSEREIAEWRAAGGEKRKWGTEGRAFSGTAADGGGLNRESRRMVAKRDAQEKRDTNRRRKKNKR